IIPHNQYLPPTEEESQKSSCFCNSFLFSFKVNFIKSVKSIRDISLTNFLYLYLACLSNRPHSSSSWIKRYIIALSFCFSIDFQSGFRICKSLKKSFQ